MSSRAGKSKLTIGKHVVHSIHVFGEPVHDAPDRGCFEEGHGCVQNAVDGIAMQAARSSADKDCEDDTVYEGGKRLAYTQGRVDTHL